MANNYLVCVIIKIWNTDKNEKNSHKFKTSIKPLPVSSRHPMLSLITSSTRIIHTRAASLT